MRAGVTTMVDICVTGALLLSGLNVAPVLTGVEEALSTGWASEVEAAANAAAQAVSWKTLGCMRGVSS